jgi:hypothetical protein
MNFENPCEQDLITELTHPLIDVNVRNMIPSVGRWLRMEINGSPKHV